MMGVLGWRSSWERIRPHHGSRSLSQCWMEYGLGGIVVVCSKVCFWPWNPSRAASRAAWWLSEGKRLWVWLGGLVWADSLPGVLPSPRIAGVEERVFSFVYCWKTTSQALLEVTEVYQCGSCAVGSLLAGPVSNSQGWFLGTSKIHPRISIKISGNLDKGNSEWN